MDIRGDTTTVIVIQDGEEMPRRTWGRRGETLFPDMPTSIDPEFIGEAEKAWYSVPSPKLGLTIEGEPDKNMQEFIDELKRRNKYYKERRGLLGEEIQEFE